MSDPRDLPPLTKPPDPHNGTTTSAPTAAPPPTGPQAGHGTQHSSGTGSSLDTTQQQPSYSDKIKVNVIKSERLKRKVLEINLVTEEGTNPYIDKETLAKLLAKVGIDKKTQMYGYQQAGRKIYVWFKEGYDIDRFCYQDSIKVSEGIKTGMVKPMDRREVDVRISGLNLNTPDSLAVEYLNKH